MIMARSKKPSCFFIMKNKYLSQINEILFNLLRYFSTMNFSSHEIYLLLISTIIGIVIGVEREYRNKSAGMRTLMLVCIGSCLFTILSRKIGVESDDRIAANIVTGIGFLGAGVIFRDDNRLNGITTASAIWMVAALGMAVGSDDIILAVAGTAIVLVILWLLVYLEAMIEDLNTIRVYSISCMNTVEKSSHYEKVFREHKMRYERLKQLKSEHDWEGAWRVHGSLKKHNKLAKHLLSDGNIQKLEF